MEKDKYRKFKGKNRKDYKPRATEEETKIEESSPVKESSASVESVFPSLTLTNANLVNIGTTAVANEFSVTDIFFNPGELMSTSRFAIASSDIGQAISAYATSRGIPTTTTANVVRDYLQFSTIALAALLQLWRSQSATQLRTQRGIQVSRAITDTITNYFGGVTYTSIARNITPTVSTSDAAGISNATWANTYLAKLGLVRLPASVVDILLKLYSVGYSMAPYSSMGNDSIVQFKVSNAPSAASTFTNYIGFIEGLFASHPDLGSILELLGFTADVVLSIDFTRDLKGLTYNVVQSEDMIYALANAKVFSFDMSILVVNDSDIETLLVDYTGENSSAFSYTEMTNTTPDFAFTLLLTSIGGSINPPVMQPLAKVVTSNGVLTWADPTLFYKGWLVNTLVLNPAPAGWTGTLADYSTITHRLTLGMANYDKLIGFGLNFTHPYQVTGSSIANAAVDATTGPSDIISEGANTYVFNAVEAQVLSQVLSGALYFGAFWRQDLQLLLSRLNKQASTIGY
jgi:hypothetical protein